MKTCRIATVGRFYDGSVNAHGFSYDGSTYTTLDVPGASRTYAYGIDGGNIVGYYNNASGYHGFLAVIPEPATMVMLGIGFVSLLRRRSKA